MLIGNGASTTTGVGGRVGSRGGVDVLFFVTASTRAEARAGSFRFRLSIVEPFGRKVGRGGGNLVLGRVDVVTEMRDKVLNERNR